MLIMNEHLKNKYAILQQFMEVNKKLQAKVVKLKDAKVELQKTNKDLQVRLDAMGGREKIFIMSCLGLIVFLWVIKRKLCHFVMEAS